MNTELRKEFGQAQAFDCWYSENFAAGDLNHRMDLARAWIAAIEWADRCETEQKEE